MARWLVLLGVAGCSPTYAPPIRGLHAGMPDRVGRGQLELGGGRWAYWNEADGLIGFWFYQAQVSLLFDLVP